MEATMSDPRYPIGKFAFSGPPDEKQREKFISEIEQTPAALRAAINGLSPQQIETPYRPGGWTVRQVVHHLPDSHLNGYIRIKLALAEDRPVIKTYDQEDWLAVADLGLPVEPSLRMFEGMHALWSSLLGSLSDDQW